MNNCIPQGPADANIFREMCPFKIIENNQNVSQNMSFVVKPLLCLLMVWYSHDGILHRTFSKMMLLLTPFVQHQIKRNTVVNACCVRKDIECNVFSERRSFNALLQYIEYMYLWCHCLAVLSPFK